MWQFRSFHFIYGLRSLEVTLVKVEADRDVCISAGNCVMVADAVFDQDDDGIVVVLVDEVPEGEEDHVREAVSFVPHRLCGWLTDAACALCC